MVQNVMRMEAILKQMLEQSMVYSDDDTVKSFHSVSETCQQ